MRVFYQILIIIAIMVSFLVLNGYLGIKNIDSMQQINKNMSDDIVRTLLTIGKLKQDLSEYKDHYVQSVLEGTDSSYMRNNSFDAMAADLDVIKKANLKNTGMLFNDFNELKKINALPANKANYDTFKIKASQLLVDLRSAETDIQAKSFDISSFSITNSVYLKNITLGIIIFSTFIAIILGLFISISVSWPLQEIKAASQNIASGNLAYQAKIYGCREVTDVVNELNHAMISLRELVQKINRVSATIFGSSTELKNSAQDSGRSAGEMAKAMEELAKGASNQSGQVNHMADTVGLFGEIVHRVTLETANIATVSEKVTQSAVVGQKMTHDVVEEINELYLSTQEIQRVIVELNQSIEEIGQITSEIGEIADQTTLLALNAAIEAARAGEHGKGFQVVASETGKLAERSKKASQLISSLTDTMLVRAKQAVAVIDRGTARAEDGKSLASDATVTFGGIFKELTGIVETINHLVLAAKTMNENNEKVIGAVTNIAAITEESMASTQEVSASAEEQSAMSQEVTALAEQLTTVALEMKQTAAVFKI